MQWIASLEIRADGVWYTLSTSRSSRQEAWEWLKSKMIWCFSKRYQYRHTKVVRDPDCVSQYAFTQGAECARDWQE